MNALHTKRPAQESAQKQVSPSAMDVPENTDRTDLEDSQHNLLHSQLVETVSFDEKSILGQLKRVMAEVLELKRQARWEDIVALCHPIEEKYPVLLKVGLDSDLRRELAFAMTHLNMHQQALDQVKAAMLDDCNDYQLNYAYAYIAYDALYRHKNREIQLSPKERAEYMGIAHAYFRRCQFLAPERVIPYYREAMLYKDIEDKQKKAVPLFQKAIGNWRKYSREEREKHHHERPKYVKALYHLASCHVRLERPKSALGLMEDLMKEDEGLDYVHPHFKHFAMAKVLYRLNKYQEAISHLRVAAKEHLDKARHQAPDYVTELMAACFLGLGRPDDAIRAISQIPDKARRPYVRWREAEALMAKGSPDEALNALSACLEKDRRSRHKTLLKMAKIYFELKQYQGVIECAKKAAQFFKVTYQNPLQEATYLEALSRYMLGETEKAKELVVSLKREGFKYPGFKKNYSIITGKKAGNA